MRKLRDLDNNPESINNYWKTFVKHKACSAILSGLRLVSLVMGTVSTRLSEVPRLLALLPTCYKFEPSHYPLRYDSLLDNSQNSGKQFNFHYFINDTNQDQTREPWGKFWERCKREASVSSGCITLLAKQCISPTRGALPSLGVHGFYLGLTT